GSGAADVVVLNTCTVTAAADHDARSTIRRIHRNNPDCRILVTGCYAQRAPQELAAMPEVTWVVGNSHKQCVGDVVAGFVSVKELESGLRPDPHGRGGRAYTGAGGADILVGDIFAHTQLMAATTDARSASFRRFAAKAGRCRSRKFCVRWRRWSKPVTASWSFRASIWAAGAAI